MFDELKILNKINHKNNTVVKYDKNSTNFLKIVSFKKNKVIKNIKNKII
jgi:hypothetical protein